VKVWLAPFNPIAAIALRIERGIVSEHHADLERWPLAVMKLLLVERLSQARLVVELIAVQPDERPAELDRQIRAERSAAN
jgi:hypothetical protein